jgi:hypothetical protein
MNRRRAAFLVVALCVLVAGAAFAADGIDRMTTVRLARGFARAKFYDDPSRGFVEFFLRVAGVAWAVVEWIAAVYLIRGHAMLRRWFAEDVK